MKPMGEDIVMENQQLYKRYIYPEEACFYPKVYGALLDASGRS